MSHGRLFIKAVNTEDCDVVSTLLQDAIFHITLNSFHKELKCLRFMLNRFCWETIPYLEKTSTFFRVHSGLYVHGVESVVMNSDFRKNRNMRFSNLLAFHASDKEINMLFSNHGHICIRIEKICVHLKDLHEKYPTEVMPNHKVA